MVLDSEHLRTFLAVAETRSFTRAAAEVHRTQAAVSMQIKKLEERIGRPLFERTGKQTSLTGDGRMLLTYARKIIALNDQAVDAFNAESFEGEIRLGLPDDYAERLLPVVLAAFHRAHPNVDICVECLPSFDVRDKLNAGALDLGIVTHSDTGGTIIRREPLVWVGSDTLAADIPDPIPLALNNEVCAWRSIALDALAAQGRESRVVFCSRSGSALNSAVAAGLAFGVLPESGIRSDLRVMTGDEGFPPLPMCDIALLRARHASQPIHDALAEHITRRLNNLGEDKSAAA
jgi:DNA-binding transcriptional LysR family regulator